MRKKVAIPVIVIIWLVIGFIAAAQRGYFTTDQNCSRIGSILVNIIAGPLNYVGVDPKIDCPDMPEPS